MGKVSDPQPGEWDPNYRAPGGQGAGGQPPGLYGVPGLGIQGAGGPPNPFVEAAQVQHQSGMEMLDQQNQANRPDISTPFGEQKWKQNPDGSWGMSTGFSGGLGEAAFGLGGQAGQMAQPMDWSQFGQVGSGDGARDQAISSAYGQSASRLDPMWNQREDAARTRLLNQGLDPSSEAYRNEMGSMGRERTDAYQSALSGAIGQGTAAGRSVFDQNMMGRQQAIAEALRRRGQPLEELGQMQQLLAMPGFQGTGRADPLQTLQTMGLISGRRADDSARVTDAVKGAVSLGTSAAGFFGG